jgi:hypothetical protein
VPHELPHELSPAGLAIARGALLVVSLSYFLRNK